MAVSSSNGRRGRALAGLCLAALISALPAAAQAQPPTPRQLVQHLLRRFSFSASPATVTSVLSQGTAAWVTQQMNWSAISDTGAQLNQPPTAYLVSGTNESLPNNQAFEAMLYQHDLLTNRQLQAKLEQHWLDHFSVSEASIDPSTMYTYDTVIRANALGNFATLVADVAVTPAMLWWLDNNGNNSIAPNVNWARELMQLYTIGEWKLNPDGSQMLSKTGQPIPNYTEADIKTMAEAMSGYHVVSLGASNPMKNYAVVFNGLQQTSGTLTFLGAKHAVPNTSGAIGTIVKILAKNPSAAPFQVTELLKRFVTETPSPTYISDIVAVWQKNVDAPNQLALVVQAIIAHPDFALAYHSMPKQSAEKILGLLRQLPGAMQTAPPAPFTWPAYHVAGQTLLNYLSGMGQSMYNPPNVFSFYLPGHVSTLMNAQEYINETWAYSQLMDSSEPQSGSTGTSADVWIDMPKLLATIGSSSGPRIASYLLDALVDGGSPGLRTEIVDFLGTAPSTTVVEGAIWLILASPEYAVN